MSRSPTRHETAHGAAEVGHWVERMLPFWEPQLVVLVALVIDVVLPDRLSPLRPA